MFDHRPLDFDGGLEPFCSDACGFTPTPTGFAALGVLSGLNGDCGRALPMWWNRF
ncbi:hypothetical protein SAMN02982929_06450 [Saccharopolyspora kobensis]|uniref:Uncharacterized protein n=1 Tax=Saccharopolyspora kobensis TaxID=146035 RepID=A0A1H6EGW2_9PSEU|nr:hypothetical protein SAMN02982929_06450 [Saccharopolyspora kobensis]SFF06928.1 hypothetical protein SAMN05216506_11898 [Saccharopolyspora kobensis]